MPPTNDRPTSTPLPAVAPARDTVAEDEQWRHFDPQTDSNSPPNGRRSPSLDTPAPGSKRQRTGINDNAERAVFPPGFVAAMFGITSPENNDDSMPVFPPCDDVLTTPPPVATSSSSTKYSIYNRADGTESFPHDVPTVLSTIITACIVTVWGVQVPRPFQVFAIFCMVFLSSQILYLIRKTGEGKSLVILTTATMLRGVTIVMVPLIGLGSDQVNKSFRLEDGVEAYHVDENKGEDFLYLVRRLYSMKKQEGRTANSIILYCSPQSLCPKSWFSSCLKTLAKRNLITSVFIDEAHSIHRDGYNGSNFRPEFDAAFTNLCSIVNSQERTPNFAIMSATLRKEYQATITKLSKRDPTVVCWGNMSRRNISISVDVKGQPSAAIKRELTRLYKEDRGRKVLIYTNSKSNAETTLTTQSEAVLADLHITADVIALTGDCGIMMKSYLMAAFCGDCDDGLDEDDVDLPNIHVMPCTSAANCGVNNILLSHALRYSMPPHMIDFAQEMGRVDRGHDAAEGEHSYSVYLSFNVVMNLFLRIFQNASASVRSFEFDEVYRVLSLLVLPIGCYHVALEEYFEQPSDDASDVPRDCCGTLCPFCNSTHLDFTQRFCRQELVDILMSQIFHDGKITLATFMKGLAENVADIYGEDMVKNVEPGNLHALALQLVASRFVEVFVSDGSLLGNKKLNKSDMYVRLTKTEKKWNICDATKWVTYGFNCY